MKTEFEINPLEVLEARRFNYLPPHFTPYKLSTDSYNSHRIEDWIQRNLNGRYHLGTITILENNSISMQSIVGFEDSREATIFFLSCPHLPKVS